MTLSHVTRLATAMTLALAACQYDPFAHTDARQEPAIADIVEKHVIAFQTLDYDSSDQVLLTPCGETIARSTVSPARDGTFTAIDFPSWAETLDGCAIVDFDVFSGCGTPGKCAIVDNGITCTPAWVLRFDSTGRETLWSHLVGEGSPYGIQVGYGDPDAGKGMRYRRSDDVEPGADREHSELADRFAFFLVGIARLFFICVGLVFAVIMVLLYGAILLGLLALAAVVLIGCALLALAAAAALTGGCCFAFALIIAVVVLVVRAARAHR